MEFITQDQAIITNSHIPPKLELLKFCGIINTLPSHRNGLICLWLFKIGNSWQWQTCFLFRKNQEHNRKERRKAKSYPTAPKIAG